MADAAIELVDDSTRMELNADPGPNRAKAARALLGKLLDPHKTGAASFWESPDVLLTDEDTDKVKIMLQCNCCFKLLSASNSSRAAKEHLGSKMCRTSNHKNSAARTTKRYCCSCLMKSRQSNSFHSTPTPQSQVHLDEHLCLEFYKPQIGISAAAMHNELVLRPQDEQRMRI